MSRLRSTFPLDRPAIARKVLRQIITDPVSWVPLVPPVALYTFFDVPGWMPLALGCAISTGLIAFWKTQWADLAEKQQQTAIREHNEAQDKALRGVAAAFEKAGRKKHAAWLTRFLTLKQKIESRIHEEGKLTSQSIQLERLVDALCFEARDQLQSLLESGSDDFSAISSAYETLEGAALQIDNLLGPGDTLPGEPTQLEEIASRLREETEIAKRVQERLKTPAQEPPLPGPEQFENQ